MSDKDFYKNAMDKIVLHTMEEIDTKQIRQKKKNMHARHRKMAAAVALVILITGGTVYAAKIGIFDANFFRILKQLLQSAGNGSHTDNGRRAYLCCRRRWQLYDT